MKLLDTPAARERFEDELERVRRWYECYVTGYVVMPDHVHLLISEPERKELTVVIQMLKQNTSHQLGVPSLPRFWQVRYYDFPVWSEKKQLRSCAIFIAIRSHVDWWGGQKMAVEQFSCMAHRSRRSGKD